MTNKIIYGLLVVMVVAFACAAPTADTTTDAPMDDAKDTPAEPLDDTGAQDEPDVEDTESGMEGTEPDVTFRLTGENFAFFMDGERNPALTVQEGDLVRIEFESTQGFHDWVLDEFGASVERVRETDGTVFVEFVADQAGEFEYYCSVGSHRANGMFGTFIVG